MFDIGWSELLVIGAVALIVIKPKDLPKVLRTVGYWVRHARSVAAEFQSSLEQMAREAELTDVKKEIEDAGRKLTAEVQKNFDPVEIEKAFNPTSPSIDTAEAQPQLPPLTEPPLLEPVSEPAIEPPAEPTIAPPSAAPAEPAAAEPHSVPSAEPLSVPSAEPTAPKPTGTDRA
jgi:sec-independent protein translocase protein TatB